MKKEVISYLQWDTFEEADGRVNFPMKAFLTQIVDSNTKLDLDLDYFYFVIIKQSTPECLISLYKDQSVIGISCFIVEDSFHYLVIFYATENPAFSPVSTNENVEKDPDNKYEQCNSITLPTKNGNVEIDFDFSAPILDENNFDAYCDDEDQKIAMKLIGEHYGTGA